MSQQHNIDSMGNSGKLNLTDDLLIAYMEGRLTPEQHRAVEELMSEETIESDAIEGLQMMHPAETKRSVAELHRKLYTEILRNTSKRTKKFSEDYWSWIAVVIILLLIVVGYIVVRLAN